MIPIAPIELNRVDQTRNDVSRPGISSVFLDKCGIRRVLSGESVKLCGLAKPGIFIPYHRLDGNPITDGGAAFGRLRLSEPDDDRKYHQRKASGLHAYLPPGLRDHPPQDMFVIEGEFKSMALVEAGYPAVGISGFFGFAEKGGARLVSELKEAIDSLNPNRIFFVGDTDTVLNYQFSIAALRFAGLMKSIRIYALPLSLDSPGKGVDDCREVLGDKFGSWWNTLVSNAIVINGDLDAPDLCVEILEQQRESLRKLEDAERRRVEKKLVHLAAALKGYPLPQNRVVKFAETEMQCPRRVFNNSVKKRLDKQSEQRRAAEPRSNDEGAAVDLAEPSGKWTRKVLETISGEVFFFQNMLCRFENGSLVPFKTNELVPFLDDPKRLRFGRENDTGQWCRSALTESHARLIIGASTQMLDIVRLVKVISNVPVLAWHANRPILVSDYCQETKILASSGTMKIPITSQAVKSIASLFRDWNFDSEGDFGRSVAFLLSLGLVQGGFLGEGRVPLFLVEKDKSGAGGSHLIKTISRVYGQTPKSLVQFDDPKSGLEEISAALLAGTGLIYFDNVRGKGLSRMPAFESLLTEPMFTARVPYRQAEVDVRKRVFAVSSNGAEFSGDLAGRTVRIKITKQPSDHQFFQWPEGSIEEHVIARRHEYLGSVYALIRDWGDRGRPCGRNLTGFRYQQWERAVTWILENHFQGLPLFDASHRDTQKLLATPDYAFLKDLLRIVCEDGIDNEHTATSLAEISLGRGLGNGDVKTEKLRIGKLLRKHCPCDGEHSLFDGTYVIARKTKRNEGNSHDVFHFRISRKYPNK